MKRSVTILLLVVLFAVTNIFPAIASEPIKVAINDDYINFDTLPILQNNRVLVPVRSIAEALGFEVSWKGETNTVTIKGFSKEVRFSTGTKYAFVNGNQLELDVPAMIKNSTTFVPLRFVSEILDVHVEWKEQTKTVSLTSKYLTTRLNNTYFRLDAKTGEIYYYGSDTSTSQKIINFDYSIIGRGYFKAENTPQGNILLTVKDNYGTPMVNEKMFSIYLHVENKVVRKTVVSYKFRRKENIKFYKDRVILTDGQTVFIINDSTGRVAQTIDLINLGLDEDNYFVEGLGENYLLVRPNKTGILTLVYPSDNTKVQLYKKLLNKPEQEYAETNDVPFSGDRLRLIGEKEDTLYFRNDSNLFPNDSTIYKYKLR